MNRIDGFGQLNFAARHQPQRALIFGCVNLQKFGRNIPEHRLEFPERPNDGKRLATVAVEHEIAEAKLIGKKILQLGLQIFRVLVDKRNPKTFSYLLVAQLGRLYNYRQSRHLSANILDKRKTGLIVQLAGLVELDIRYDTQQVILVFLIHVHRVLVVARVQHFRARAHLAYLVDFVALLLVEQLLHLTENNREQELQIF